MGGDDKCGGCWRLNPLSRKLPKMKASTVTGTTAAGGKVTFPPLNNFDSRTGP